MVSIDADPLDGPRLSSSDVSGSVSRSGKFVIGAGIFFMLLTFGQQFGDWAQQQFTATTGLGESPNTGPTLEVTN